MRLWPQFHINNVRFWSECYLRWNSACQVSRGGEILQHIELLNILAEINNLTRETASSSQTGIWKHTKAII